MPRLVPDSVRMSYPYVDPAAWLWESPDRLCAPHDRPGYVVLVVLTPDHCHWMGQCAADTPADRAEVWTYLETALAVEVTTRDGCRSGDPLLSDDDPDRCRWCGIPIDQHETPGIEVPPGATYQETNVGIGGEVMTTVEAEALMTVTLAELKYGRRGRYPAD